MPFVSYAQNHEDVLLFRALGYLRVGFYIDIGANHPKIDSVTQAFYDRGWSGINAEPIQAHYKKLVDARQRDINLQEAISDHAGEIDFYDIEGSGLSTTVASQADVYEAQTKKIKKYRIPCLTLGDLCRKYVKGDIQFLKIDVEGAEELVIRGGDWVNYRPWIVMVESTIPNTRKLVHHRWEPILRDNGYQFAFFDGLNRFYVANEHETLMASFKEPVCCLDDYISYSEYKLLQSFLLMQLDTSTLKSQVEHLDQANKNMAGTLERLNGYLFVKVAKKVFRKVRVYRERLAPIGGKIQIFLKNWMFAIADGIGKLSPTIFSVLQKVKKKWFSHLRRS